MHQNNPDVALEAWGRIKRGIPISEILAALEIGLPTLGFTPVANQNTMPDFTSDHEYRIKHVHWRHIAEFEKHADDPNEIENWELKAKGREWERFTAPAEGFVRPSWVFDVEYRRNPLPKPDKYGWLPTESVPFWVPVDLYNKNDKTDARIHVVIMSKHEHDGSLILNCSGCCISATHWRPSTGRPE